MSAMWRGRLERFSPLRWRASLSMERMSPTSSRRLARSVSRKTSSSLVEKPAWFLLGLLRGGGGGGMMVETVAALACLPLADLPFAGLSVLSLLMGVGELRGAVDFTGAGLSVGGRAGADLADEDLAV